MPSGTSHWEQVEFSFKKHQKGCHLVTSEVLSKIPQLKDYTIGTLTVFIKHTSAALTLNENCDPSVRVDMHNTLARIAPEDERLYTHNDEGPDDMPGHVKSSLLGASVTIPITNGRLNTGTWQGIWLCEFRDEVYRGRTAVATINGLKAK
ncbi:Hypothetical protein PP7435_CHR2-1013 [Komagataella phaffii CBS 7435]|uniref:Secondary thiamine-phosphate synthase enzyme n=2 Tax=Komagataella phaffii TaxID=460519 RepID=C4R082_KOMPG|nr:Hypothetical protein PAS_chr2-1_0293 [Komagataella phaffii GS115]AOA62787.1 GQ67_00325T0 [Komagataella phaffii]KAI0462803.1 hypothetical protein LJB42_003604 [Komagataella kurtzmanii]CAH2448590.1 Hypothetical protein BQ9382_C2-5435 [Komagataella phaffii CBS 7435]AOA67947.1 GQ68_01064T0 [Komagataella phaffii GS115]CAY68906.1 Hypothetical protein PAS_chr2-1_0293 [Komagataella phaffii GS115]